MSRLADDHRRAKQLAAGLRRLGLNVPEPATNMVYFEIENADEAVKTVGRSGIHVLSVSPTCIRAVTHLDVDDAGIEAAIAAFEAVLN